MNENRYDLLSGLEIVRVVLVSAHLAHDDRINAFQVGWVCKNFNREVLTIMIFGETGT